MTHVYVVGCGHSGTSVLFRSIGNLPGVRCIQQETRLFHRNTGGAGRLRKVLAGWDDAAREGNFTAWVEKTPRVSDILQPPGPCVPLTPR